MKQTLNFNINIPELGDTPDITQISDAIQDMEDALAGTVEFMNASVSGTEITLSSPTRITNRIRYYEGMAIRFTSNVQINKDYILTAKIDSLPTQLLSIPFLVTAGDTVTIIYESGTFLGKYSAIPRSSAIDSTSVTTVPTSSALKVVNDKTDTKEPIINKNTGFNKDKSDAIDSTSIDTLATSKAVKTAYDIGSTGVTNASTAQDKADSAYALAFGKEPEFSKNSSFNKNFGTTSGTVMDGDTALLKRSPNGKEGIVYLNGDNTGDGVAISAGGLTIVGGGEYSGGKISNMTAEGLTGKTEALHIGSDTVIKFESGAQIYSDRKKMEMEASGVLRNDNGFYCGGTFENNFPNIKTDKIQFGNNDTITYDDGANLFKATMDDSTYDIWTGKAGALQTGSYGYQKLPSGFIIQWGNTTGVTGTNVHFAINFPTICRVVVATDTTDSNSAARLAIDYYNEDYFEIKSTDEIGAFRWIALGY